MLDFLSGASAAFGFRDLWVRHRFRCSGILRVKTVKLNDIEVDVPPDIRVSTDPPHHGRVVHTVEGSSVVAVRNSIESAAVALGYAARREGSDLFLRRGEQSIEIYAAAPTRLRVRVDDPEALPHARVTNGDVAIGRLSLPIKGAQRIEPGRERHDAGSNSWKAEWRIYGKDAEALCSEIHEKLVQDEGLRSNGIWSPPKGGIPQWCVEAYSPKRLVKAYVKLADEYLLLTVVLIDEKSRSSQLAFVRSRKRRCAAQGT